MNVRVLPITGLGILDFSGSSVSTASHHSNNQNNLVWSSYFGELAFTSKPTEILYYRYLQDSSSKELSFLLSLSLKRSSQNDRSPGQHHTPQIPLCFHFLLLSWGSKGGEARPPGGQARSPHTADEAPSADTGQSLCKQACQKGSPCTRRSDEGTDLTLRDGHLTHLTVPCRGREANRCQ